MIWAVKRASNMAISVYWFQHSRAVSPFLQIFLCGSRVFPDLAKRWAGKRAANLAISVHMVYRGTSLRTKRPPP